MPEFTPLVNSQLVPELLRIIAINSLDIAIMLS